ncbi:MAG: TetR/AcrR family transcriptional regulator, partial [Pseudomonadota bacterium]
NRHCVCKYMATNKQRREATRASILTAARECFVRDGYGNTHTDTILESAQISRGAMYHHFSSKRDVFEAVYVSVVKESIDYALGAAEDSGSPVEDLVTACTAWLGLVRKPAIASILIEQGPQVLGWKRAREIESESSLTPMRIAVERACSAGEMDVPSVEVAAMLINALLAEAALISLYRKPKVPLAVQEESVRRFIEGLGK